jgi:hypothetical protein
MRLLVSTLVGISGALLLALPVAAATETPTTQDSLPIGLVLAVIAGLLTFAYVFTRPSRITGRKD